MACSDEGSTAPIPIGRHIFKANNLDEICAATPELSEILSVFGYK
jgi:hypothetical protein